MSKMPNFGVRPYRKAVRMKFSFSVLVCVFLIISFSTAQAGQFVIGRYAGEFLSLGAGARSLAMGGASVANPTAAAAGYYNPSRLAGFDKRQLEFMHAALFDNLYTYDQVSYAQAMRDGYSGGLTIPLSRVTDIPLTKLADPNQSINDENRVLVGSKSSDNELAIIASVGKNVQKGWRLGANAKLLHKSVAKESAFGLGFDVAAGRTLARNLEFGIAARDITTSVLAWSTGNTEAIIPSLLIGGSYQLDLHALDARVSIAADLDGHFESRGKAEQIDLGILSADPRIGIEYLISNTVALRGGINGDVLTAGAGLHISKVTIDAAFQNHEDLGFTHRVSLGVAW
jgi:hypothetical protein